MKGKTIYVNLGKGFYQQGVLLMSKGDDRRRGTDIKKPLKTIKKAIEKTNHELYEL